MRKLDEERFRNYITARVDWLKSAYPEDSGISELNNILWAFDLYTEHSEFMTRDNTKEDKEIA
jgi:hypothetical protein